MSGLIIIHCARRALRTATKRKACPFIRRTNGRRYHVLGIESSCDDTAVAVVNSDRQILGESLHSQQQFHLDLGGIVPVVAFKFHKQNIARVVNEALERSKIPITDIDAIAVTVKPGLELSLKVGLNYAKKLAKEHGKLLIPIHHMEAHALVIRLLERVDYPFLVLLISGGHCQIALVRSVTEFFLLGSSMDKSPGEMLDKVARRLKLRNIAAYSRISGGQAVELAAKEGDPNAFVFEEMLSRYSDCNFAFSGMKSAAYRIIEQEVEKHGIEADGIIPSAADLCASLQYALTRTLARKVQRAMTFCRRHNLIPDDAPSKTLVVAGGVASNHYIRKGLELLCNDMNYKLFCPPPKLCTDNGVMIAWNGIERLMSGLPQPDIDSLDVETKSPLGKDIRHDVSLQGIKAKFKLRHDEILKLLQS